jgi:hypothetical protein
MSYEARAGSQPPRYTWFAAKTRKLDDAMLALSY